MIRDRIARATLEAPRRGHGLIGLLITMACIVVLMAIGLASLNRAVTGEGNTRSGTVHSVQDQIVLAEMHRAMWLFGQESGGWYLVPSNFHPEADRSTNTTANFYSAMIARNFFAAEQLVSANEHSPYVEPMTDYDHDAYQPRFGQFWDPRFSADLDDVSNVSFAHLPLFGERCERNWGLDGEPSMPIVGARGPKDGQPDPSSFTHGDDGTWAGYVVTNGGSIHLLERSELPDRSVSTADGRVPDNPYAAEDGPAGADALLGFTKAMTEGGPELQWD